MIFVTVGTHEQQFNRLVECVDQMKQKGLLEEEVIIQTGFSTYEPKHCRWQKLFPYKEMVQMVKDGLERTGGYCPCRLERTQENKCICKEFREQIADPDFKGYCHCMLYYKD